MWGLDNGNKTWHLIGDLKQETDAEHPLCPLRCLEMKLQAKPDSFY